MNGAAIQYATTSDAKSIAYTVYGTGRSLIWIPALFSHIHLQWRFQPDWYTGLAANFRFVSFDARGEGLSSRGLAGDHSMGDWERDLEAVVDATNTERAVLLAGCHAAHVAVRFALKHPERVEALVLNTVGLNMKAFSPSLWHGVARENWDQFLGNLVPRGLPVNEARLRVEDLKEMMTPDDLATSVRAIFSSTVEGVLPSVRIPTLVLHPRQYVPVPFEESARVARLIPGARFQLIDGSYIYGDGVQGVAAVIAFLNEVAGAGPSPAVADGLSGRELEVLRLVAAGKSNPQIADDLVISLNTVQRHVSSILAKVGLANRTEAATYALRHNLN
jgi:pimeloyl-ACP methyl ester carboxylesterase/DNA-binding CsgD family transcriptional regulator